ncbi:uncharacterized protein Nnp-1 [Dermacentor andersoni]|uniref:uncharacterized protein Nnp-1 n=1 Tax=Dermacentor andersoni TaxID=34620 RepID=UPI002155C613|nr:ribosomal RNA processing protein 1 homolog B-like [Dermacentor andersoni]
MPVSQEVHFAHHLAANEKVTRDRALRKLTRWIRAKSGRQGMEFTEEALMKLWKGLFFCMWMSDKPFVQQELANSIAGLVHCFARRDQSLLFLEAFFKTMAREWFAIDRFRLEKFMMLVRRCFRQGVAFAYGDTWNDENITAFCNTLKITALCPNSEAIPLGFRLHVVDVFLQELARMHGGELTPEQAILFLQPFFDILMHSNDRTLLDAVRKNIFFLLLDLDREAAELGVDPSTVKLKGSNGTTGDGDSAGDDEAEEEDMYDEHGRVLEKGESCQDLPAIPFDYSVIADGLFDMLKATTLKPFNRALITRMVKKFRAVLEEGLVRPKVVEPGVEEPITEDEIEAAANKLEEELEEELEEDRDEVLKLKEKKQKVKPKFGFDTTSGAYEYIVSGDGDSEEDEGLGNGTARNKKQSKAKQLRKKVQALSDEEATDTLSDLEDSEDKVFDVKAASKKRKRCAALSQKAEEVPKAEGTFDGAEDGVPPKKKQRRRKPKKPKGSSVDDAAGIVQKTRKLNGFDKDTSVTEREFQKGSNSVGKVPIVEEKKGLFTAKKADRPILGKTPQKKLLSAKKKAGSMGVIVQQQVSKPILNRESSTEGPAFVSLEGKQQRKVEKLLRQRQARKEKKERGLAALTRGWQVTPLPSSANKAKQSDVPVTPVSLATCADKTTESTKLPHSSLLQQNSSASAPSERVITKTEKSPDTSFKSHKIVVAGEVKAGSSISPPTTLQASGGTIRQTISPLQGNKGASTGPHSAGKNSIGVTKAPHSPLKNHLRAEKSPHTPVQNNSGSVALLKGLQPSSKGMFTSTLSASLDGTEAKASSDNTPVAKLPCTPKASNPVVPALRKCFTARKPETFKLTKFSTPPVKPSSIPQEEKKVIFALSKNKAQDPREYFETLKNSPEIPFDASKKPAQGVLKARLSLPSSTPVTLSAKRRVRMSDVFQSNANQLFPKKRPSASDFF